jgi:sugar lactone lactonase YvrE
MRRALLPCALVCAAAGLRGEGTAGFFAPRGSFTVEVSLENSAELRLPARRSAITSLAVMGDFAVGGTTAEPGLDPFLFAVSLSRRRLERVLDLGTVVAGQRGVRTGFVRGGQGGLYAGTMPDRAGSGHLIRVSLGRDAIVAEDLGSPVAGEGIFALTSDGSTLFGIAHPSGRFFAHRLRDGHVDVYDKTAPTPEQIATYRDFELKPEDYLCRRLVVDGKGRVFGSLPINRLFRFDPRAGSFEMLAQELPSVWDRRVLGRADAWAVAADGTLFGGSAGDGLLFKLDPDTGRITNLGSPAGVPRLTALAFAGDGALYGLAGLAPQYSHLFRFDPRSGGFEDYGTPQFPMVASGIPEDMYWRGLQLGTLAVSEDGRLVVMGDEELMSQLMVFPVTAAN